MNLDKAKKLSNWVVKSVVLLIILLVIAGIVVGFISYLNRIQREGEYPYLNVNLSQAKITIDSKLYQVQFPQFVALYQTKFDPQTADKTAKEIANSLGIKVLEGSNRQSNIAKTTTVDKQPIYTFYAPDAALVYYLNTGFFYYTSKMKLTQTPPNKDQAVKTAQDLLQKSNLLPSSSQLNVRYLTGEELSVGDERNFNIYDLAFIPTIDNLPLISSKSSKETIHFQINRDFSIFKLEYNYIPNQKIESKSTQNAKSALDLVKSKHILPSYVDFDKNFEDIVPEDVKVTTLNINSIELVYYEDPLKLNKITPTFRISGNFTDTKGDSGRLTILKRAI